MLAPEILLQRIKQVYFARGIINLGFGGVALFVPNLTAFILIALFGINSIFVGLVAFRAGILDRIHGHSGLFYLLEALVAIFMGSISLLYPEVVTSLLVALVGVWAVILGVIKIVSAISYQGRLSGVWWLSLAGWVYLGFGLYLLSNPTNGIITTVTILGIGSIISGISFFILAKKLKNVSQVQVLIDKQNQD